MLWEAILFYLSSYLFGYILFKITQSYFSSNSFNQNTWIRYYCLLVVLIIHFIWIHCSFGSKKTSFTQTCHLIHHNQNIRNFIFPILFLTPIYIIFFINYFQIQYYNIDQEKTESEWTQKVNRILAKIMILMFIVTIVFLFLTQRYQKRTIQFIDILSIFEVF